MHPRAAHILITAFAIAFVSLGVYKDTQAGDAKTLASTELEAFLEALLS